MKKITLILLLFIASYGFAQQTYYWVGGATGAWSAAASWNTIRGGGGSTRTTPNTGDVLVFDSKNIGGGDAESGQTVTPSNLTEETISSLILMSNETYSKPLTLTLPSVSKVLTVTNDLLMSYYTMLNDGGNTIKVGGNVINGIFNGLSTSTSATYNFHAGTGKIELAGTNTSSQSVLYATRTNNGSGYTSSPTVIVGTPWTVNTAFTAGQQAFYGPTSAGVNGASLFTVITGGTTGDATTAPTTKIGGDINSGTVVLRWVGFAAKATCGISTSVNSITNIITTGTYTSSPSVSFTGGGGSGATGTANLDVNGKISSVTITNAGTGYSSAPTVAFTGGLGGGTATGTAVLTAALTPIPISSLTITCPGSGYTSAPAISFTGGGGSGATAIATVAPNCYFLLQAGNVQFDANTNYNLCFSGTITINGAVNLNSGANLNFNFRTLSLGPSASITLAPKANLNKTSSTLTLNSRTLTLQSDATGTATLVDNTTTSPQAITATVQQYLGAARNWYISSPITAATVPSGQTYYKYDETGGNTVYSSPATAYWTGVSAGTTLTALKGYIAQPSGATTLSYTGTLNTGTQTIPLTRTAGKTKEGFNLVGNPYPSYLDWSLVDTVTSKIMSSVWYRTKTLADTYTFDTYNGKLNVATTNGANTVTKLIPPMQAFWVRVKEGQTTGTLTFTNTMRKQMDVAGNKFKISQNNDLKLLRLQVSNGTNSDETILCFHPNASNAYDDFDSPKMSNSSSNIPEIYTLAGSEQMVINGLNSIVTNQELPLGFSSGEVNSFSIKASQVSNFDDNTRIIINEKLLNIEKDITDGSPYNFSSEAINTVNRFGILFRSPSISTGIQSGNDKFLINIFKNLNNQLVVHSNVKTQGVVTISNAVGQRVCDMIIADDNLTIDKVFKPGVYFVTVMANGFKRTQKIIL